jgi:hypothetical protein
MNETYRLNVSTLAILSNGGRPSPVSLPAGAVVALRQPLVDAGGFVENLWNGQSVTLLAYDLKERGERVRDALE